MKKINAFLTSIILSLMWIIGLVIAQDNYKLAEIVLLCIYVVVFICICSMESFYGEITFFVMTFGLFLCSYPIMDLFGVIDVKVNQFFSGYAYTNEEIIKSTFILSLTLIIVLMTYSLLRRTLTVVKDRTEKYNTLPRYFWFIFYSCGVIAIVYRGLTGVLFSAAGAYANSFAEEAIIGPSWIQYFSISTKLIKALLFIAMAYRIEKKQIKRVVIFYFVVSATQLLSGQRGPFIVEALFLIWYYCNYYHRIKVRYMIIPAGAMMFIANAVSFIRNNQAVEFSKSFISDFVQSQGVSFDVVASTVRYYPQLVADNKIGVPYFLGMVHKYLSYMASNLTFQDSIFGHGQTQAALDGSAYLGWKLTNIISPYQYSIGRGTGSSFVAENYLFFKYFGVVVLTIAMIWFVQYVKRKAFDKGSVYASAIYFIVIQSLIYAPRNNFWMFISDIVAVFVVLLLLNAVFPKLFKINTHINYSMEE